MNVSFNGFKNAGTQIVNFYSPRGHKAEVKILNCELTNDVYGKDLENFEYILKQAVNPLNNNFLRLCVINPQNYTKKGTTNRTFQINDKIYEMNYKNLGIFQRITDLLKKIISTPQNQFKVNNDYIEGGAFLNTFILDEENVTPNIINIIHRPKNIKASAKEFIDDITDSVDEFLS